VKPLWRALIARVRMYIARVARPVAVLSSLALTLVLILLIVRYSQATGTSLWDWLRLLVVPAVIAGVGVWFNWTQKTRELNIARSRAQDEALQAYLDQMSQMLTDKERPLHRAQRLDHLSIVARARTLTVLPRLDSGRKRSVLQFLRESQLINVNRTVVTLIGADLQGANLQMSLMDNANLRGVDLRGATLHLTLLTGADLQEANLQGANLLSAHMEQASLHAADLKSAELGGAHLYRANLTSANLESANLESADLRDADLSTPHILQVGNVPVPFGWGTTNLQGALLTGAALTGANVQEANLQGAMLLRANLTGANFQGAILQGAILQGANLQEANLQYANLLGASLRGAYLEEANLQEADLREAKLQRANLQYANLQGANLQGATFREAMQGPYRQYGKLRGSDLQGAKGLGQSQIEQAIGDNDTTLPEGIDRPKSWSVPTDE
jgi:uncharacterized protein YjbI with pentapeptide repeats